MTEKQTGRINAQLLTKCINHWADSANFKGVTFNKICSGLTGKCFEMPNASYTNRWHLIKKNEENKENYRNKSDR